MALWSNFVIWELKVDPPYGGSETFVGEWKVEDPGDVALLDQVWSTLWSAAAKKRQHWS